jgi:hypothetical protein
LNPTIATVLRRSWIGMTRIVSRPRKSLGSAGPLKPVLSRANQAGAATAAKITMMIASAEATGSTPRFQRATRNANST